MYLPVPLSPNKLASLANATILYVPEYWLMQFFIIGATFPMTHSKARLKSSGVKAPPIFQAILNTKCVRQIFFYSALTTVAK